MSREGGHPTPDRAKISNLAEHKRSSGVSYSLLGIGAALSLHENEDEVSNFIASAMTEALEVKLGAVALLNGEVQKLRVFGQLGTAKAVGDLSRGRLVLGRGATNDGADVGILQLEPVPGGLRGRQVREVGSMHRLHQEVR